MIEYLTGLPDWVYILIAAGSLMFWTAVLAKQRGDRVLARVLREFEAGR